ncbi:MAG: nitroreductase family protein [Clostridia bacterium]|nr:nitroreductase family protein [Clostridia bacterium]MBQ5837039.1 nitroreductase family protein [Clostridia bacterium]
MNQTIKTLTERRSVRKFTDKPISKEDIELILKAGVYAPTGRNTRDTLFLAITQKELISKLSKMNAAVMGSENDPFYGAPAVIVVFADRTRTTTVEDGSCAMANLMNAAFSLGIDSCWIHRAREVFESEEGREIARSLGIPDEYIGIGNCILGYRDCELPTPVERTQPIIFVE